jgi:hypothetical protein
METKIPTHDQIRETFASARDLVHRNHLCLDATIDDYPIGRRERGKCRLQVERAAGKGYRTVRTTTNKFGRWCAPKKSVYQNGVWVVIKDWDVEHQVVWLGCGKPDSAYGGANVGNRYANDRGVVLAGCWRQNPVRREPYHYTSVVRTSRLGITAGGLLPENRTEEREQHVLEADSPEEIAAWDVWYEELKTVRQLLLNVWEEAEVVTT